MLLIVRNSHFILICKKYQYKKCCPACFVQSPVFFSWIIPCSSTEHMPSGKKFSECQNEVKQNSGRIFRSISVSADRKVSERVQKLYFCIPESDGAAVQKCNFYTPEKFFHIFLTQRTQRFPQSAQRKKTPGFPSEFCDLWGSDVKKFF